MVSTFRHQHAETRLKLPDSFPKVSGARETNDAVAHLYLFMKDRMGEESTEPPGAPDLPKYLAVRYVFIMYTLSGETTNSR